METKPTRLETAVETKILKQFEDATHVFDIRPSQFLTSKGFVEPAADHKKNQFGAMIDTLFYERGEDDTVQKSFHLGTLPKNPADPICLMRHMMAMSGWANANQLMLRIDSKGKVYLTTNFWNYKEPNGLPYSWMAMIIDGLTTQLEQ